MLTKLQKKYYNEIKAGFSKNTSVMFSNEEYLRYRDILELLVAREVICDMKVWSGKLYDKIGSFDIFEEWLNDYEKEERKLSRREWKIAIIGGGIGSLISFLPDIISIIKNLYK